jgi:hypothetical protein
VIDGEGQSALPVFTEVDELHAAARRFGWVLGDGSVASQEVGAREALRYILSHDLSFVVVDIASDHAMEIGRAEVEPLLHSVATRDSHGPYAAVGRVSSSMLEAVSPSSSITSSHPAASAGMLRSGSVPNVSTRPPPSRDESVMDTPSVPPRVTEAFATAHRDYSDLPQTGTMPVPEALRRASAPAPAADSSVRIEALAEPPSEALLSALFDDLREYPEVEWAAIFAAGRGPGPLLPTVGLRVDTAYRARVDEIVRSLRAVGGALGASLDVLLLDDMALMRQARAEALVFFPWQLKSRA